MGSRVAVNFDRRFGVGTSGLPGGRRGRLPVGDDTAGVGRVLPCLPVGWSTSRVP